MKHIVLAGWPEFEESLRANLYPYNTLAVTGVRRGCRHVC